MEAPSIHETEIHRIVRGLSTGRESRLRELVDRLPALGGDRQDRLSVRRRVGDLLLGEVLEPGFHEQHHECLLADDHARGVLVGETGVEREAERGEEPHGLAEVADGEVDEDLSRRCWHGSSLGSCAFER